MKLFVCALLLALGACSGSVGSDSSTASGGTQVGGRGAGAPVGGRDASGGSIGLAGGGTLTTGGSGAFAETGGQLVSGGALPTGGVTGTGSWGSGGLATGGIATGGAGMGGITMGGSGGGGAAGGGFATGGVETGATGGESFTGGTGTGGIGGSSGSGSTGGTGSNLNTGGGGLINLRGTVGYPDVSPDGDLDRAKIEFEGEQYIIQNNNYGDPANTDLILEYFNNSFTIVDGYGAWVDGQLASFPSIYIGANGDITNGIYTTAATDNLPRQVSQIARIQTTFSWSGATEAFAAAYDLWFANSPPTAEYLDAIDGFIRIWMHDPRDWQPIGSEVGAANVAGHAWNIWMGPRGEGPAGYNNSPVVTFVAQTEITGMSFDLVAFLYEAADYGIHPSLYLTDVFFGFEIFAGGAGGGLSVDTFTCLVE
jgi:hypothetical protein